MNRKRISLILLISCAISIMLFLYIIPHKGVTVIIRNVDKAPLHSVVVYVTGNSYPIGDINPNNIKTITVISTGESSIEIEHGASERRTRLKVDCYFEPGYKGHIKIDMATEKIVNVEDKIRISPI